MLGQHSSRSALIWQLFCQPSCCCTA
jgi:hypothetical protein